MDFQDLLIQRRSIRDFQPGEVPLSVIRDIIQDTCLAPTARNGQPCRFIVVQDRERIRQLSRESKNSLLADLAKDPASPLQAYEAALRDEGFNVFYNAPCLVYITGPRHLASIDVDCALTAAYFMMAATLRGLGTCWIGLGAHIRSRKTLDEMGIPEDHRIVAPVAVGYPAAIPPALDRHEPLVTVLK